MEVLMRTISDVLELIGVAVILMGVGYATVRFLWTVQKGNRLQAYRDFRANLGRGILLGLEILVGADIISTVTEPLTWTSVSLLALIVLIRTFLSFALETEIEGTWPWRRKQIQDRQ